MPRTKKITKEQQAIIETLQLFLTYYSTGLLPFMDCYGLPDEESIGDIVLADAQARSRAGKNKTAQDSEHKALTLAEMTDARVYSVIRNSGGFELWRAVFADFQEEEPELSAILRDLSLLGTHKAPSIKVIAWKHNYGLGNIYPIIKARRMALQKISGEILHRSAQIKEQ